MRCLWLVRPGWWAKAHPTGAGAAGGVGAIGRHGGLVEAQRASGRVGLHQVWVLGGVGGGRWALLRARRQSVAERAGAIERVGLTERLGWWAKAHPPGSRGSPGGRRRIAVQGVSRVAHGRFPGRGVRVLWGARGLLLTER